MDPVVYGSLTRSERAVLRLLSREKEIGEVATALGLTTSTVETYIKTARRKLGGVSRYVAARSVREYEASLNGGSPVPGLLPDPPSGHPDVAGEAMPPTRQDRVQEEPAAFHFDGDVVPMKRPPAGTQPGGMSMVLLRLLMVVGVAFTLAALLLLAIPLGEGAQRLANIIDPPQQR